MTEQEAIKWVDDRMCYGRYTPQKHRPFMHDECCQAGELAIKALEKQIAKKPKITRTSALITFGICPNCGTEIDRLDNPFYHKDADCLQKLDWSKEE